MPVSVFGILTGVFIAGLAVMAFFSFSVYVLGADSSLSVTWGWKPYASIERGFAIMHPGDVDIDPAYRYDGLGHEKEIQGVSFSVPHELTAGTNLSSISKLSVETLPSASACTPDAFLYRPQAEKRINENGVEYEFAAEREVKHGVVHEEQVYTLLGSSPCVAVRYTLYAALIKLQDAAAVKEYDHASLQATLDSMRHSLSLTGQ